MSEAQEQEIADLKQELRRREGLAVKLAQAQSELAEERAKHLSWLCGHAIDNRKKKWTTSGCPVCSELVAAYKRAESAEARVKSLTDEAGRLKMAWEMFKTKLSGLLQTLPPRPICASHASVPLHVKFNLWDAWVEVEKGWDEMDAALSPAQEPSKEEPRL